MAYHVLEAAAAGMRGMDSRRVALVHYTGTLPADKLKINERFKGLRIVKVAVCNALGHNSHHMRTMKEWQHEAKALNNGSIIE